MDLLRSKAAKLTSITKSDEQIQFEREEDYKQQSTTMEGLSMEEMQTILHKARLDAEKWMNDFTQSEEDKEHLRKEVMQVKRKLRSLQADQGNQQANTEATVSEVEGQVEALRMGLEEKCKEVAALQTELARQMELAAQRQTEEPEEDTMEVVAKKFRSMIRSRKGDEEDEEFGTGSTELQLMKCYQMLSETESQLNQCQANLATKTQDVGLATSQYELQRAHAVGLQKELDEATTELQKLRGKVTAQETRRDDEERARMERELRKLRGQVTECQAATEREQVAAEGRLVRERAALKREYEAEIRTLKDKVERSATSNGHNPPSASRTGPSGPLASLQQQHGLSWCTGRCSIVSLFVFAVLAWMWMGRPSKPPPVLCPDVALPAKSVLKTTPVPSVEVPVPTVAPLPRRPPRAITDLEDAPRGTRLRGSTIDDQTTENNVASVRETVHGSEQNGPVTTSQRTRLRGTDEPRDADRDFGARSETDADTGLSSRRRREAFGQSLDRARGLDGEAVDRPSQTSDVGARAPTESGDTLPRLESGATSATTTA